SSSVRNRFAEPVSPLMVSLLDDQTQRWRRGERVRVENYLAQHPVLQEDTKAILQLIYQEVTLRAATGETPQFEDYQQRFPHLASQLKDHFDLDRANQVAQTVSAAKWPETSTQETADGPGCADAPEASRAHHQRQEGYDFLRPP